MRSITLGSIIATAALAISASAVAAPWGGGGPGGHGGMGMTRGHHRCGRMLMHMPAEELKAKLKLDDQQLARAQALRNNLESKRIDLQAQAAKHALRLRQLLEADQPNQGQVLAEMRKMRNVRGVLAEEQVKAFLGFLSSLSAEQRKQLRAQCSAPGAGFGHGWGRGMRGMRGGPGWGAGPGGAGWGGPPPPPPPGR